MRFGTVSYNLYGNFTNYGSALQTWALHQAVNRLGGGRWQAVLVDYCPEILVDKDVLNPFKAMWDQDEESQRMCRLSMPAIRENAAKFDRFYRERFVRTRKKYIASNFADIQQDEGLSGYICGSDTIFCPDEFGIDDGYFANYNAMKNRSIAYAASFGDPHFTREMLPALDNRLKNFLAIGLRESSMLAYVRERTQAPVKRVIDPTLLLSETDYEPITEGPQEQEPYLLLYARRYNTAMEAYARRLARENGWRVVEISLRATNAEMGHRMRYDAGVEEFLSLVRHARYVVTNSYHALIFSVQFQREFAVFCREQSDTKIGELLSWLGLADRRMVSGEERPQPIDYGAVKDAIERERAVSRAFLLDALGRLSKLEKEEAPR